MTNCNIFTWNVNGLNSPIKRTKCLEYLHRKQADIVLIQESHLKSRDVHRFQNKHYKVAAASSAASKTCGVIILLRRKFSFSIEGSGSDSDGRMAYLLGSYNNVKLALVSLYAPTEFDPTFFPKTTESLLNLSGYKLLIGADMNTVCDPRLDRSRVTTADRSSKSLNTFIADLNVCDAWRLANVNQRNYTFFSSRHKTYSRIDYLLMCNTLIQDMKLVDILPILLSDHSPVVCNMALNPAPSRSKRWRFNTSLLQSSSFILQLKTNLPLFIEMNQNSTNPQILWETIKCFIRGNCISFASFRNKSRIKASEELETKIISLETKLKQSFNQQNANILASFKSEYQALQLEKAEFLMHRTKTNYYYNGERPSKLLALRLKNNEAMSAITAIKKDDSLITKPEEINTVFKNYYSDLYSSDLIFDEDKCKQFLSRLNLPKLHQSQINALDAPITMEELKAALGSMQKGKSPGLDGLPPELYSELFEIISPHILNSFNHAIEHGSLHRDQNTALISLLLKKGKDPHLCNSFRPISLISTDAKLYAKILTKRLETVADDLIHYDQTGFVCGRLASDNIRRLLNIIDISSSLEEPCAVFSLDATMAFDRVSWPYLWSVLEQFGFGKQFMHMIKVLYNGCTATVCTGQTRSTPFKLHRGTRQGCPLSPLLFALFLEPLAQAIRLDPTLSPISIKGVNHHISLYADDIALYLSNLTESIPRCLEIFDDFSNLSGYQINWSKSVLMPLNDSGKNINLPPNIPVVSEFTYLGIRISTSLQQIVKQNYTVIFNNIKDDLQKWAPLNLTIQGRIATVKMNILPRLNFLFAMLPLSPPQTLFPDLKRLISAFVWNNKRPRIKISLLQQPKPKGGLSLPDLKLYFWAFQIKSLRVWMDKNSKVTWRSLEDQSVFPYHLEDILFTGKPKGQSKTKYNFIVLNLLNIWHDIETYMGNSLRLTEQSPIWNNHNLMTGNEPFTCKSWLDKGVSHLKHIFNENGLRTFQDLQHSYSLPGTSYFMYLRLRSALRAYGVPWGENLTPHPLLKWLLSFFYRSVSPIYGELLAHTCKPPPVTLIWDRELSKYGSTPNWTWIWEGIPTVSKNPAHQLILFKLIHRAYTTPYLLHKMGRITSPLCTHCNTQQIGTYMHMFWECSPISRFWDFVSKTISDVIHTECPKTPDLCLLNDDNSLDLSVTQRRTLCAGLTAAKKTILKHWFNPQLPMNSAWLSDFKTIALLERSTARMNKAKPHTISSWDIVVEELSEMLSLSVS